MSPLVSGVAIVGDVATIDFHDRTGLAARYLVEASSDLDVGGWDEVGAYAPNPATSLLYQVVAPATNRPLAGWLIRPG